MQAGQDSQKLGAKIHLVQSDDAEPRVKLSPGRRYEVVTTSIVDIDFQAIGDQADHAAARPARLCGSRSTCVAIVEIE